MNMREQTAELNKIPIQVVGNYLGLELPSTGSTNCPFPDHADKSPSFEIKKNGIYWRCYGCNISGGSIDLVKQMRGVSFIEARSWLLDRTSNLSRRYSARHRQTTQRNPTPVQLNKPVEPESSSDFELYTEFLALCPLLPEGQHYLASRCISEKSIELFRIGQIKDRSAIEKLVRVFGFKRVHSAGLLTTKSTAQHFFPVLSLNSLLFPYLEDGEIVYFQSRSLTDRAQNRCWRNLNYRKRRLFNSGVLGDQKKKNIAICEGVIDTISAHELNIPAVGFIGVSTNFTTDEISKLQKKNAV